jgi:spermidine synthase
MSEITNEHWFTEPCTDHGSAFSLSLVEKLHEEQTAYQRIAIYETEGYGTLMVIDGCIMLSDRDNFIYHEMMSHPALFAHPQPERVVIIGGGDCGTLREVLRHSTVTHALQVELDERVTRLAERYFPLLCESNDDVRASFMFSDGIRWMAEGRSGDADVIIIDSTDPVGPAQGLFTESFYRDCHRALDEDGIMVQQSESPLYHMDIIRSMRDALRAAGFAHVQTLHFPQPTYPSGWWSATLASKTVSLTNFREQDARRASMDTRYYNADIHRAAAVAPEFFRQWISQ